MLFVALAGGQLSPEAWLLLQAVLPRSGACATAAGMQEFLREVVLAVADLEVSRAFFKCPGASINVLGCS